MCNFDRHVSIYSLIGSISGVNLGQLRDNIMGSLVCFSIPTVFKMDLCLVKCIRNVLNWIILDFCGAQGSSTTSGYKTDPKNDMKGHWEINLPSSL